MSEFLKSNIRIWLRGLAAAFIGGGSGAASGALALVINDPNDFNAAHPGKLMRVGATIFLISGISSAFAYLKKSPIPDEGTNP